MDVYADPVIGTAVGTLAIMMFVVISLTTLYLHYLATSRQHLAARYQEQKRRQAYGDGEERGGGGDDDIHPSLVVEDAPVQAASTFSFFVAIGGMSAALLCCLAAGSLDIVTLQMEGIAGIVEQSSLNADPMHKVTRTVFNQTVKFSYCLFFSTKFVFVMRSTSL